jgi:TolA-binding protein
MRRTKAFMALLALCAIHFAASAQSEKDVLFAKKLNDLKMHEYSEYFLKKVIATSPADVDRLRIELADTYIKWNKSDKGEEIIGKLNSSSPYYGDGQYVIAMAAIQKNRTDLGLKSLEKYIKHCLAHKPDPKDKVTMDQINLAFAWLRKIYTDQGMTNKLGELSKQYAALTGVDQREITYYELIAKLDAAEKIKEEQEQQKDGLKKAMDKRKKLEADAKKMIAEFYKNKGRVDNKGAFKDYPDLAKWMTQTNAARVKSGSTRKISEEELLYQVKTDNTDWQSTVHKCLKDFRELRWGGQDVITAFSYAGAGRALFMLGRYKDALKEFDEQPQLIKVCDDAFKRDNQAGQAPGASIRYWKGRILMLEAEKEKDKDKQEKLYIAALKKFLTVLLRYEGYSRASDAYGSLLECKDILTSMGKEIKIPKINPPAAKVASVVSSQARQYFKDEQYDKAIPLLLKDFVPNKEKEKAPEALYMLAMAYSKNKQDMEAMSTALYLGGRYADANETPIGLLQVGNAMWDKGQKDDAIRLYEVYFSATPTHDNAPDFAMRVAMEYYARATAEAKAANKLSGDQKKEKVEDAIAAYKLAIPKFQRMIDQYGHRKEYCNLSYYMLGLCYSSSKQFTQAAQKYLEYCQRESNTGAKKDLAKIASAKLGAADAYFQAGQELEKQAKETREKAYRLPKEAEAGEEAKAGKTPQTQEAMLALADNYNKEGKEFFKKSISELKDLIDKWSVGSGILANTKNPKIQKTISSAEQLIAWGYDAAGEKKDATVAFQNFIKRYPKSKKAPACMMRLGVIYTELGNDNMAEKILGNLVKEYPQSQEGKNATFFLARSLWNNEKYLKSIDEFKKIFKNKQEISVQSLRWISNNLADGGGQYRKDAAGVAMLACQSLLTQLNKPKLEDWVGKAKAATLSGNAKELKSTIDILRQKLQYDMAIAAAGAGDYTKSVEYLDKILADTNTPYFYKAKFARADANINLKQYNEARKDLSDISMTALGAKDRVTKTKADYLAGEASMKEGNYKKAFSAFNLIATTSGLDTDETLLKMQEASMTDKEKRKAAADRKASSEWVEKAVYYAAYCAAKLAKKADADKMVELYKKYFPKGEYINQINKLPKPEAANK